jgi:hypothetical protein
MLRESPMSDKKKLLSKVKSLHYSTEKESTYNSIQSFNLTQGLNSVQRKLFDEVICVTPSIDKIFKGLVSSIKSEGFNTKEKKIRVSKKFNDLSKLHISETFQISQISSNDKYHSFASNIIKSNPKSFHSSSEIENFLKKKQKPYDNIYLPNIKANNVNIHLDIKNININNQHMTQYQQVNIS